LNSGLCFTRRFFMWLDPLFSIWSKGIFHLSCWSEFWGPLQPFQIIYMPCGEKDNLDAKNTAVKKNIRDYVDEGGRFVVTDWSYEFVKQPYTSAIRFVGDSTFGGAATLNEYDTAARADDPDLKAWLAATGDPTFETKGNWSTIQGLGMHATKDLAGNDLQAKPKTWISNIISGSAKPATVTFESTCGRVMFSTYHTETSEAGAAPSAQEKALIFVLLQVSACNQEGGGIPN
jgi:hypothetical protein